MPIQRVVQIEWYALLISIVAFPLFESPKTIFLFLSAAAFIVRHVKDGSLSRTLLHSDPRLGFLAVTGVAVLASFFAIRPGLAIQGALDPFLMFLLFSMVATDFSDERSVIIIAWCIIAGTVAAAVWGLAEVAIQKRVLLELHSVGHANHSSIYLALAFWVGICQLAASRAPLSRMALGVGLTCIILALLFTQARATFLAVAVSLGCFFMVRGLPKRVIAAVVAIVGAGGAALWSLVRQNGAGIHEKGISTASLVARGEHWQMAWQLFLQHPITGIGAKSLRLYDPAAYGVAMTEKLSHAHNLFLNTLVHFGMVGIGALIWLLFLSFRHVARLSATAFMRPAACAGLIIVVVNGLLNTTLHSEHGLLFALVLAMSGAQRATAESGGKAQGIL